MNQLRSHARFYRRLTKDFSKIARPLIKLLEKDFPFVLTQECLDIVNIRKDKLTNSLIMVALDWNLLFKLMGYASALSWVQYLGKEE